MSNWDDLTTLLNDAPGDYSVCVWKGAGGPIYGYREQVVRSAASLIKVPLAMAVLDAQRALNLDEPVTLHESDRVEGEGSFDVAPAGTIRTARELIAHSLIESDNTASNLLIDRVGFASVNRLTAELGLQTRMRRRFMDFDALAAGRDNVTTAADMCALFHHLLQARYAPLRQLLTQAIGSGKLEAGLPAGVALAHKTGDLPGVEHDVGIIFAPDAPYIVAALGVALPDADSGKRTIAAASRKVWELMTGNGLHELRTR